MSNKEIKAKSDKWKQWCFNSCYWKSLVIFWKSWNSDYQNKILWLLDRSLIAQFLKCTYQNKPWWNFESLSQKEGGLSRGLLLFVVKVVRCSGCCHADSGSWLWVGQFFCVVLWTFPKVQSLVHRSFRSSNGFCQQQITSVKSLSTLPGWWNFCYRIITTLINSNFQFLTVFNSLERVFMKSYLNHVVTWCVLWVVDVT